MSIPKVFPTKSKHLGINISANTVSVIKLDDKKNIVLSETLSSEIPFFINDDVNQEALSKSLANLATKFGGQDAQAAICFPERMAYSREHTLPKIKISEIDEALSWQISTIFPLQPEDIYYDWRLLTLNDTGTKIVVVAVNRKFLDGLKDACVAAGIQPFSFEPSAGLLARAQKDQSKSSIILEVDSFGTSASLIENGVSSLTTTSLYTTAENLEQIIDQIDASIKNLLFHRKSLNQTTNEEFRPTVFLTGVKAAPKLAELLATKTQLTVEMLAIPTTAAMHLPYLSALSVLYPPQSELSINLLPETLQQQYQLDNNIKLSKKVMYVGLTIGSLCLLFAVGFLMFTLFAKMEIAKVNQNVSTPEPLPDSINIPQIVQKASLIASIAPLKLNVPVKPIQTILDAGVKSGDIHKLTYSASTHQLQLTMGNVGRDDIYLLKNTLEKTNQFTSISVPLSVFSKDSNPLVTISMIIK